VANYRVLSTGYRALRLTVTATLGATLTVMTNSVANPAMISAINVGPAPHATGHQVTWVRQTGTATAASTQLVAAPTNGMSIYVTDIIAANSGAALTVVGLLPAAGTATFDMPIAATGGGATINLTSPWRVGTTTALNYTVSVATSSWFLTVGYYLAL
jgi:hypothetical protein